MNRLRLHHPSTRRSCRGCSDARSAAAPAFTKTMVRLLTLRRRAYTGHVFALLAMLAAVLTLGCTLALADQGVSPLSVPPGGAPHQGVAHQGAGSQADPAALETVLESADPQPQGWLPAPPRQVSLRFRESLQPAASAITVSTSRGRVDGSLAFPDPHTMTFQFQEPPGEGTYFVQWQASLSSGRTAEGRFHFTYLAPAAVEEPLDRREVNRLLGNLLPPWLLWLPAALGVGALVWGLWSMWRHDEER